MIKSYIRLMRVHHYIKNLLIFAALICSGQFFIWDKFLSGIMGFCSFCLVSSAVYIINDIRDREKDRMHPVKCMRPIAAGIISVKSATILGGFLFVSGMILNMWGGKLKTLPSLLLILYMILNLMYSFGLKNIPIVDVSILAAGFLIRVIYGAIITGITVSNWLYLTVVASAFFFSLGKRRNELNQINSGDTRKVLEAYSIKFLDKNVYMCLSLVNVFYALWTMDKNKVSLYKSKYLVCTVPIVLLITMRYSMDIENDVDGDPVEVLLHDKMLLCMCVIYFVVMTAILYL